MRWERSLDRRRTDLDRDGKKEAGWGDATKSCRRAIQEPVRRSRVPGHGFAVSGGGVRGESGQRGVVSDRPFPVTTAESTFFTLNVLQGMCPTLIPNRSSPKKRCSSKGVEVENVLL